MSVGAGVFVQDQATTTRPWIAYEKRTVPKEVCTFLTDLEWETRLERLLGG